MARRRGLEFGVFDQTPRKLTRRLGPNFRVVVLMTPSYLFVTRIRLPLVGKRLADHDVRFALPTVGESPVTISFP